MFATKQHLNSLIENESSKGCGTDFGHWVYQKWNSSPVRHILEKIYSVPSVDCSQILNWRSKRGLLNQFQRMALDLIHWWKNTGLPRYRAKIKSWYTWPLGCRTKQQYFCLLLIIHQLVQDRPGLCSFERSESSSDMEFKNEFWSRVTVLLRARWSCHHHMAACWEAHRMTRSVCT